MDEVELRREAVRRRAAGETTMDVALALGRSTRWVRKWSARHDSSEAGHDWARSRSRAPKCSPSRTPADVAALVLAARERLVANPRSQYGALAIAWELRNLGVDPVPHVWTINRILAAAGVTKARRRQPGYVTKGVPYPVAKSVRPGEVHQADLVGPRHLDGGIAFHALHLIDVGSHTVGNEIIDILRAPAVSASLTTIWARVGLPTRLQLDNHANLRGGIQPRWKHFGPVVAACLDLGVVPRFTPLREPWRNGVIEHYNDLWDKAFFRTTRFAGLEHLRAETAAFETFHNARHRYSAHAGASPDEMRAGHTRRPPPAGYTTPTRLPDKGRIEAIRFVRSNRRVDLWGHHVTIDERFTYRYITAVIRVRARELTLVTDDGEIAHRGPFALSRELQ